MRRSLVSLVFLSALADAAEGQGLRQKLESGLFSFGTCGEPLCLPALVTAGNAHGRHFIPSAEAGNAAIIAFLGSAVGANVSNIPISATTSGVTYSFEGGVYIQLSRGRASSVASTIFRSSVVHARFQTNTSD